MNLLRSTLLLALVVPTANALGGNLLNTLLGPLLNTAASTACAAGQQALGLATTTTCTCDGQLMGGKITAQLDCKLTTPICLNGTKLCGQTEVSADFGAGIRGGTGLSASAKACLTVTSGFPLQIISLPGPICVTGVPGPGFKLKSCSVDIGTTPCQSCTVCNSGVDIKFNCTNVNLYTGNLPLSVPGPNVQTCVGLSLIPTNTTNRMLLL
jgi:hypothetical protein